MRIVAIVLIALGALALVYGHVSYTEDKTAVKLGPVEVHTKETKTVALPTWAGIAAIAAGAVLFVVGARKR